MILVTGINGEMGSALIKKLNNLQPCQIIGLDIKPPRQDIKPFLTKIYTGDIKDKLLIKKIFDENNVNTIYHLAAVLSTKAESIPFLAHQINVDGFLNLMYQIYESIYQLSFSFPVQLLSTF